MLMLFEDYLCQGAILDVLQEDPNTLFVIVEICALDHLITTQKRNQTCFIDNKLSILLSETFNLL